jgi:predicted transcriptional regulator
MGLVEYTIPNKPNSKNQQYRLTARGSEIVERRNSGRDVTRVMDRSATHLQDNSQSADDALKTALKTALKNSGKNYDDDIVSKILELYRKIGENPHVTLGAVAQEMRLSERTVDDYISVLKISGALRRKDGKKFGVWETLM